jgi:hypothetical protein
VGIYAAESATSTTILKWRPRREATAHACDSTIEHTARVLTDTNLLTIKAKIARHVLRSAALSIPILSAASSAPSPAPRV